MDKCYITIQWHLTENCLNKCRHCYMNSEEKELSKSEILKILKNINNFEKKWNFEVTNYILTGGDPLLAKNFEFILNILNKNQKNITILGIPETINDKTIELLKKYNILNFQMSLDGLEKTHDYLRGKGSFERTLEKVKLLEENGISVNIMFTVNNQNQNDLIPLMDIIVKNEISSFSFDFLCSLGNGKNLKRIRKEEIKKLLEDFLIQKKFYLTKNSKTFFHEKSSFIRIIREEKKDFSIVSSNTTEFISGCYIGFTSFAISTDGYFMPCRRIGEKIGNLLKESLDDIFFLNQELKKYRRKEYYEGCSNCNLFKYCRGCPAISKGESGDGLKKTELCFKEGLEDVDRITNDFLEKTTKSQERKIISNHLQNKFLNNFEILIRNKDMQDLIFLCLFNEDARKDFIKNYFKVLEENNLKLTLEEVEMSLYYLELYRAGKAPNLIKYVFGDY